MSNAETIHERYRKAFVGRSRATRDLALLDTLISDTEQLVSGGVADTLRATVDERLTLYKNEREEIAAIQAGGPAAQAGWRLAEWSEVNFSRYVRHFAGQSRPTRDLGLLQEMAAEEAAWIAAMPSIGNSRLDARRAQMEANLRLYTTELTAIADARATLAPAELARVLASAANTQFGRYRQHFEGKPRTTRRPALLERVIDALEAIRVAMVRVRDLGVDTPVHAANITKVTERIAHHRGELVRIRQARAESRGNALAGALGDEANKLFGAYRTSFSGQPRETRDLAALSEHCDALQEIARTMQTLENERPDGTNTKNLAIVLDHLKMAEREHVAIAEVQKKKK